MPMGNLLGPTCRFKVILSQDISILLQTLVSEYQYGAMKLHELIWRWSQIEKYIVSDVNSSLSDGNSWCIMIKSFHNYALQVCMEVHET